MINPVCMGCKHESKPAESRPCSLCYRTQVTPAGPRGSFWEPAETPACPGVVVQVTEASDPTNPQHYRDFPVEVIQLVRHLNFNRGNAIKYLCRAGRKTLVSGQELEDLKKALWYVQDEIQRLTGEGDHAKP